jgi:guanylate kinase
MDRTELQSATTLTSRQGRVYVVSGPSGVGKDMVLAEMLAGPFRLDGIHRVVTATTRPARSFERDGIDYHFLSEDEFAARERSGWFLETAPFGPARYGTPRGPVETLPAQGLDVILKIDTKGAMQVKALAPGCVLVFIWPPSVEELETRLRSRSTEKAGEIAERMRTARQELATVHRYDFVIVNRHVSVAADALRAIIVADRHRLDGGATCP